MNIKFRQLIDFIYDGLFKENRQGDEWIYEDKLIKRKIADVKKSGAPKDLLDPIEVRYYDKLELQVKEMLGVGSFLGMKIAEFGSGTGILSARMARNGASVVFVDSLQSCLEYSKLIVDYFKKIGKFLGESTFKNQDFMKFKANEPFDLVHSIGIIEHFEDSVATQMVRKMKDSVKKGGYVIVGVPNFLSPDMINIWRKSAKGDEHFFSKMDLYHVLENAGLKKIKVETSTFFYPSFVPEFIIKHTRFIEDFFGKKCGLGFLVIGVGVKV